MIAHELGKTMARLGRAIQLRLSNSYARVFDPEGNATARDVEIVLADLRDYCRADRATWDREPHVAARLDGRRDVWLRLNGFLRLTDEQIAKLVEIEYD